MALADTYRRRLRERALDQYGYVTTRDAADLGVPVVELRKISHWGGIEHINYGLYRFEDVPRTGHDQFLEAVLLVGPGAYLTHDAVLALLDLGLVNPRRTRVGTPKRVRKRLPEHIEVLQRHLEPNEITLYEGIPSTTLFRALLDCRGLVMADRLAEAARQAASAGLLRREEVGPVLAEVERGR
jgi:predicted transcriptional regulator of viral defense system